MFGKVCFSQINEVLKETEYINLTLSQTPLF